MAKTKVHFKVEPKWRIVGDDPKKCGNLGACGALWCKATTMKSMVTCKSCLKKIEKEETEK